MTVRYCYVLRINLALCLCLLTQFSFYILFKLISDLFTGIGRLFFYKACTVPVDCTSTSVNCFSESNELECDTCSVGYLLDNNVCTACTQPDNCATFAENCFPGSSKLECSVCSEGYSLNNNVCS
eukprot:Awhi_evm1s6332